MSSISSLIQNAVITDESNAHVSTAMSLLERVCELAPMFADLSATNEAAGKLTQATEQALRTADLLGLFVPVEYGGADLFPSGVLQVLEALFVADASTAWVAMASNISVSVASHMELATGRKLFAKGLPICAGQGAPNGRAQVVAGGYRLTGAWSYGSGIKNADYVITGALVMEGDKPRKTAAGAAEVRMFVLPVAQVKLADNWDVIGLRATGSVDYSIDDVFVPEEFAVDVRGTTHKLGGASQSLGIDGRVLITHTSFAMGVARRALDEIALHAAAKGGRGRLADNDVFRQEYALAEAKYRSARALVMESWSDVEASLTRGESMSMRQTTLCRLALVHMTDVAAEVSAFAYRAGGGVALRNGNLQRYFRDAHAGAQHIQASHSYLPDCGLELLGLAENKQWSLFGLVDRPAVKQ